MNEVNPGVEAQGAILVWAQKIFGDRWTEIANVVSGRMQLFVFIEDETASIKVAIGREFDWCGAEQANCFEQRPDLVAITETRLSGNKGVCARQAMGFQAKASIQPEASRSEARG
ncbi:hypothetical protein CCACVL1_17852 [Corchorus capsularis]|uniref:Uncharacterized protein n=1 Tax=Corchorus capsularis TaxID=210143 RepID=A0A1R3HPY7_COCAP|nr:hypothetical protein CCACVL1_17852 [Corchorus capsularis]